MYPVDRRRIAINIYFLVNSLRKTAALLQVSYSSVYRWISSPDRCNYPQRKKEKTDIVVGCLGNIIKNDPFASLRSIQNRIHSELQKAMGSGVYVNPSIYSHLFYHGCASSGRRIIS